MYCIIFLDTILKFLLQHKNKQRCQKTFYHINTTIFRPSFLLKRTFQSQPQNSQDSQYITFLLIPRNFLKKKKTISKYSFPGEKSLRNLKRASILLLTENSWQAKMRMRHQPLLEAKNSPSPVAEAAASSHRSRSTSTTETSPWSRSTFHAWFLSKKNPKILLFNFENTFKISFSNLIAIDRVQEPAASQRQNAQLSRCQ